MPNLSHQHTLKNAVTTEGIGVHSGKTVRLTLHPAPENTGVIFRRVDLTPVIEIPATHSFVRDTQMNTSISHNGTTVATIEHLLSAFSGLHIDNAYVDIDGPEMPVMDGSAHPFVDLINTAEILEQNAPRKFIFIKEKILIEENNKWASLTPFEGSKLSVSIAFDHPAIQSSAQQVAFDFAHDYYSDVVSRARTFGFLSEYEYLKKNNLAQGASLENTVVLGEEKVLNPNGLRYPDEFVRHKLLDVMGDLYLLGHPFIGHFEGHKTGHHLNHQLRETLFATPSAWEIISLP